MSHTDKRQACRFTQAGLLASASALTGPRNVCGLHYLLKQVLAADMS